MTDTEGFSNRMHPQKTWTTSSGRSYHGGITLMPQSQCTVGPSRRRPRMTSRGEPGSPGIKSGRHREDSGSTWASWMRREARKKVLKKFVARLGYLPVFSLRDSTGKAPGWYRDHRGGTGTIRKNVFHYGTKPVDPGGSGCWLWWSWIGSVHHGSLGLGTVDQGVTLRKHPGRSRLAPGFRG